MVFQISNPFKKTTQGVGGDSVDGNTTQGALSTMHGSPFVGADDSSANSLVMASTLGEVQPVEAADAPHHLVVLPILGERPAAQHQRTLSILLVIALIALAAAVYWTVVRSSKSSGQVAAVGHSLMESQRLAKSASLALVGTPEVFPEVRESSAALGANLRGLQSGNDVVAPLDGAYQEELGKIAALVARAEKNAAAVLGQQQVLSDVGGAVRLVSRQSGELMEVAEAISSLKQQQGASVAEIMAVGQLSMLTQRIGKSASELLTLEGVSPEAVFLLGKDLNSFQELANGLLNGSPELRLPPTRDEQVRERFAELLKLYGEMRQKSGAVFSNLQGLVLAREAQRSIVADTEPLRKALQDLGNQIENDAGWNLSTLLALLVPGALGVLAVLGMMTVQLRESRYRQMVAEQQRHAAELQQQESTRVNKANQAAILRLMNELQTVAEGDLTQEATVTEDITGAIADSVNYTVEELRSLVGSVQNTATRVAQTTTRVEATSTELLATSTEQLREIRETGQSVLDMAERINDVSAQAQESASVARQSLQAAASGLNAVQDAIGGMNSIRDQIQETSKRIKRLGESSQEIGEITELIADITEQTNVLALNAAIQAAAAGEAGRGFSVVAEEVQRLAERSGDATRQIATLVKTIQTDTQDAVAAMERSTQGVVEGARLSDNAGTALSEIDSVSRRLAELIEQISDSASKEAAQANVVAGSIQHIFAVTEQTGESTRSTANQVRELARMADELRQSVARFKIA